MENIGYLTPLGAIRVTFSSGILKLEDRKIQVKRTFLERFFTLPWKPWKRTKVVIKKVPVPTIYFIRPVNHLLVHTSLKQKFLKQMEIYPQVNWQLEEK
jgi:hypothetical protein